MKKIQQIANGGNAFAQGDYSYAEGGAAGDSGRGIGGDGGDAHAVGHSSTAVGGRGGRGGRSRGGTGGDAIALGEGAHYYGGDGGEACQYDGRGGRGGAPQMLHTMFNAEFARRAAMKLPYGMPNVFPGRGGDSPDTPQYMARRLIVERVKLKFFLEHGIPTEGAFVVGEKFFPASWLEVFTAKHSDVWYDRTIVPLLWLNEEIQKSGNKWSVAIEAEEYVFEDKVR
jgi:hypothetical protein